MRRAEKLRNTRLPEGRSQVRRFSHDPRPHWVGRGRILVAVFFNEIKKRHRMGKCHSGFCRFYLENYRETNSTLSEVDIKLSRKAEEGGTILYHQNNMACRRWDRRVNNFCAKTPLTMTFRKNSDFQSRKMA